MLFQITNPIVIPVIELNKWWLAQPAEQSHVLEALQALNTLWVHGFSSAFLSPANRSTTYIGGPEAQAMGLGREHFPFDVGGGVELWRTSLAAATSSQCTDTHSTGGVFQ